MSTSTVYRFRCDAPQCSAVALGTGDGKDLPDGWTEVSSTAHIRHEDFPLPPIRTLRGRMRPNKLDYWDAVAGRFSLHLCGEHPHVFDEHKPIANGRPSPDGKIVYVSCSCGAKFPYTYAVHFVGDSPRFSPERMWWKHLPAGLQWYATREVAA